MMSSELELDPKDSCLLVIDVQNDYCHDQGAFGQMGIPLQSIQDMVRRLVPFIEEVRQAGVMVIFIRNQHSEWDDSPTWLTRRRGAQKIVPVCVEGSWGTEFYQVNPTPADRVVVKHRYSAFIDTDLDLILRSRKITSLVLTGVATNVCVESTARHGFMKDYQVTLVEDCCAATSPEEHQGTLLNISKFFGDVARADTVLAALRGEAIHSAVNSAAK
ncbi:MAG: isochorismatase family cysteine hydrolase [Candidatus Binatia bacterium]